MELIQQLTEENLSVKYLSKGLSIITSLFGFNQYAMMQILLPIT